MDDGIIGQGATTRTTAEAYLCALKTHGVDYVFANASARHTREGERAATGGVTGRHGFADRLLVVQTLHSACDSSDGGAPEVEY